MNSVSIRRQRLRHITVEVRDASTLAPAGTGVLVSADGFAVTCGHVLDACNVDRRSLDGEKVLVRLPKTKQHPAAIDRMAHLAWFPTDSADDLVILQLEGGPIPPERVGTCGPAGDDVDGQPFESWGYRLRGEYTNGLLAVGVIDTHVGSEENYIQDPLQLTSPQLDSGMSGAAVLDIERNIVVGFVFQVFDPEVGSLKDRDLAWAVDAGLLAHSPLKDLVAERLPPDLVPQPAPPMHFELKPTATNGPFPPTIPPPSNLGTFVGRKETLSALDSCWLNGDTKVVGITGFAGYGKTSVVKKWASSREYEFKKTPFWWTFDPEKSEEDGFLSAVIEYASSGSSSVPTPAAKANWAARLLPTIPRTVIVIDDVTQYQDHSKDLYGYFTNGAIQDFLTYALTTDHHNLIIVTSELPYPELEYLNGFRSIHLDRLTPEVAVELLRANGVVGEQKALEQIAADWDGHPQALTAVAIYLKSRHHGLAAGANDLLELASDADFEQNLQAIGEEIRDRRSAAERLALEILSLARGPLEASVLLALMGRLREAGVTTHRPAGLDALFASEAIRRSSAGLLPHPILRNLYRRRTRSRSVASIAAIHRLLANHYYASGLGAHYGDVSGPGDSSADNKSSAET